MVSETTASSASLNRPGARNATQNVPARGREQEVVAVEVILLVVEDLASKEIGAKVSPQILGVSFPNQTGSPHKFGCNSQEFNNQFNRKFNRFSSLHPKYMQCNNLTDNRGLCNQ